MFFYTVLSRVIIDAMVSRYCGAREFSTARFTTSFSIILTKLITNLSNFINKKIFDYLIIFKLYAYDEMKIFIISQERLYHKSEGFIILKIWFYSWNVLERLERLLFKFLDFVDLIIYYILLLRNRLVKILSLE